MGEGNAEMQKDKEVPELFLFSDLMLSLIKSSYSKKGMEKWGQETRRLPFSYCWPSSSL